MSTNDSSQKQPRYEKLAKPKLKVDRTSNVDPYKIKPSALSYQITDTINKLAQPKRKPDTNLYDYQTSSARPGGSSNLERPIKQKLINSSEESRNIIDLGKKKNLLDSYARITATRNRRCPKRLRELAKPTNRRISMGNDDTYENYEKNFYQGTKNYTPANSATFGNRNRR